MYLLIFNLALLINIFLLKILLFEIFIYVYDVVLMK